MDNFAWEVNFEDDTFVCGWCKAPNPLDKSEIEPEEIAVGHTYRECQRCGHGLTVGLEDAPEEMG